jgi:sugar phosphate isomerase/epimerase
VTWPAEIGISTAALYPSHATEDALVILAGLGFRLVEIFLQCDEEYSAEFGETLDQRRRELGLEVHSLHLYSPYFDLWSPYERMAREVRDRFGRLLAVAAAVDARALTWHGLRYGLDNPRLVEAFFESVAWAAERAQAGGLTLCIENVSWCYLRTPEHARAVVRAGLPVGFTFDAFQAGESGVEPAALIRAMGDRLTTVHLSDYLPGAPRHLAPGRGELDWPALFGALVEVDYRGPLILEPAYVRDHEVLLEARAFVRRGWDDVARRAS